MSLRDARRRSDERKRVGRASPFAAVSAARERPRLRVADAMRRLARHLCEPTREFSLCLSLCSGDSSESIFPRIRTHSRDSCSTTTAAAAATTRRHGRARVARRHAARGGCRRPPHNRRGTRRDRVDYEDNGRVETRRTDGPRVDCEPAV